MTLVRMNANRAGFKNCSRHALRGFLQGGRFVRGLGDLTRDDMVAAAQARSSAIYAQNMAASGGADPNYQNYVMAQTARSSSVIYNSDGQAMLSGPAPASNSIEVPELGIWVTPQSNLNPAKGTKLAPPDITDAQYGMLTARKSAGEPLSSIATALMNYYVGYKRSGGTARGPRAEQEHGLIGKITSIFKGTDKKDAATTAIDIGAGAAAGILDARRGTGAGVTASTPQRNNTAAMQTGMDLGDALLWGGGIALVIGIGYAATRK